MSEGHTERLEAALDGKYRLERKLGEGGMASVYLAEDIKHERKVALKILRPELVAVLGAERFLSEIKTTANLQHPHILPLFDSGQAEGYLYYVMPFIEGETLREKLDREKQLGVEESVRITSDVAEALDYAHRAGVIHRDIKPGNILLHDGQPVVADFGIALAISAAGGGRMTETGLSLGTPRYMSPEQASADRDLSARSDVYSLGCVLYEMLAGQAPHTGSSVQAILAHVLTREATPVAELRHTVPTHVAAAVARAIEKLPADRFESAAEFRAALGDPGFRHPVATPGHARQAHASPARDGTPFPSWLGRRAVPWVGAAVMAALAAWGWLRPSPAPPEAEAVSFTIAPPAELRLRSTGLHPSLAISPDGRLIVYEGPTAAGGAPRLNTRALGELASAPLRGASGGLGPVVSPDGAWVAFVPYTQTNVLQRNSTLGGSPVTLVEAEAPIRGVSWGSDGAIVFGTAGSGLYRVRDEGGTPEPLTTPEVGEEHLWPSVIEGRSAVVFVIARDGTPLTTGELAVLDLASGRIARLRVPGVRPRYVATGHIVYATGAGTLTALPFDGGSLAITGEAASLVEGINVTATGAADFDLSANGHLVYVQSASARRFLVWVDRTGREEAIDAPPLDYYYPRISRDGDRAAIEARGPDRALWIWDFSGETLTRLQSDDVAGGYPTWSPDGQRIAYNARDEIRWKAANNTGTTELLVSAPRSTRQGATRPYFFTPDGMALVAGEGGNPETGDDLVMTTIGPDARAAWRLAGSYHERNAELSPDGRWMAYESDESGRFEIYVRPFPQVEDDQVQVSNLGGQDPLWGPGGNELLYREAGTPDQLVSATVEEGPAGRAPTVRERQVLMDWPYFTGAAGRNYDLAPDGQRFLAIRSDPAAGSGDLEITVVLDWHTELRALAGS